MSEQQTKLSLQVGKKYRNRKGEVIQVTGSVEGHGDYRFRMSTGLVCTSDGFYWTSREPDSEDLIEEVVELSDIPPRSVLTSNLFVMSWNNQSHDLHVTARDRGFYTGGVKPLEYSLNWMHAELGEVFTALQQGGPASDKIEGFSQVEEELADVVILLMDAARAHGLRVAEAVVAKNTYNLTRPYKHGKVL